MSAVPPLEIPIRFRPEKIPDWATAEKARVKDVAEASNKAAKDAADVAKREKKATADAASAVNKALTESEKKEAAERLSNQKTTDKYLLADYKDRVRQQIAEANRLAATETKDAKEAAAAQVRASNDAATAKRRAAEEAAAAWAKQNDAIMSGVKSVGMFALSMAGLSSASTIVNALAEQFDAVRRQTFEAAKEVIGFREEILELAALKDHLGDTTPALVAQIRLRGETLQTAAQANKMELAARGIGEAAIGRTVAAEDFQKLLVTTGKLQVAEGSDAGAYGLLAGTLALQAKPGEGKGSDLSAKLSKMYAIQKPGGFLNMAQFAKQYAEISPYIQSGILSQEEAAGMLSALSLTGPETASTRLQQAVSGASTGLMRARGMKIAPEFEHETSAAYFKSLGIKAGESPRSRLEKIAADLNVQKDAATAANKDFLANEYLVQHGSAVKEANDAYIEMAGLMKSGVWQGKFVPLMNAPADSGMIDEMHKARTGREPVLQQRAAELAKDVGKINASAGKPVGELSQLQQAAFEREKSEGHVSGTFEAWKERGFFGRTFDDSMFGTGHQAVDFRAQEMLVGEAQRVGIKARVPTRTDARTGVTTPEYMGDRALFSLQQKVQAAGGNPMADVARDVKRAADAMEKAAAIIAGPAAAPMVPGAGKAPPVVLAPPAQAPAMRGN